MCSSFLFVELALTGLVGHACCLCSFICVCVCMCMECVHSDSMTCGMTAEGHHLKYAIAYSNFYCCVGIIQNLVRPQTLLQTPPPSLRGSLIMKFLLSHLSLASVRPLLSPRLSSLSKMLLPFWMQLCSSWAVAHLSGWTCSIMLKIALLHLVWLRMQSKSSCCLQTASNSHYVFLSADWRVVLLWTASLYQPLLYWLSL